MNVNPARGEVGVPVYGIETPLVARPTFEALAKVQGQLGSLYDLALRLEGDEWRTSDLMVVLHECCAATGCDLEDLSERLVQKGLAALRPLAAELVAAAWYTGDGAAAKRAESKTIEPGDLVDLLRFVTVATVWGQSTAEAWGLTPAEWWGIADVHAESAEAAERSRGGRRGNRLPTPEEAASLREELAEIQKKEAAQAAQTAEGDPAP